MTVPAVTFTPLYELMWLRKYIVGAAFLTPLLIDFGFHGEFWFGCIILIPVLIWFAYGWAWKRWQPDAKTEALIARIFWSLVGVEVLVIAGIEAFKDFHYENTKWIRTRDGQEAVGDDVLVHGPDWLTVVMLVGVSAFIFYYMVLKHGEPKK